MHSDVALKRYLERHIEPNLPVHSGIQSRWHHVVVIPCYRESAALLQRLRDLETPAGKGLIIIVLNRPSSDDDANANAALRQALGQLSTDSQNPNEPCISHLTEHCDIYCHDLDRLSGPTPKDLGVGLARKTGCDIALKWICAGGIEAQWIGCSDGDAHLPRNYFARLSNLSESHAGATFPFVHTHAGDSNIDLATTLYELKLHHYVLGLQYAKSAYAYHSLGSALAVHFCAYAKVRGFPKRAAAEDFYLLNKLAKVGTIAKLQGECIVIDSRISERVPFGTGPAVRDIANSEYPLDHALFYHPQTFECLRVVLECLPSMADNPDTNMGFLLKQSGLPTEMTDAAIVALESIGLNAALAHCHSQSRSQKQFLQHFNQWFDAFRTLKFLHQLRDAGFGALTLKQLWTSPPNLWPEQVQQIQSLREMRSALASGMGWSRHSGPSTSR